MDIQAYVARVNDDEQNNISVDFDGVIHDYQGLGDGTVNGKIINGAREALAGLSENYRVILFTTKAKPDRPLVNGKTGTELVWEWLEKHNVAQYVHSITCEKPRAFCYIDDKAIRFEDWSQTLQMVQELGNKELSNK